MTLQNVYTLDGGQVFSSDNSALQADGLDVNCPPTGKVGDVYSGAVTASGGTPAYTYAVLVGSLPPGLTLNADGTITGTPTGPGDYDVIVRATDSLGAIGDGICTIVIQSESSPAGSGIYELVINQKHDVLYTLDLASTTSVKIP